MHLCTVMRHHCTGRKGNSVIFSTKKGGYFRGCQATKRVDSIRDRLFSHYSVMSVPDISIVDITGTTEAPQSPRDRGM